MNDKRELNDILIGGEDPKSKNTKKLILLIIAIVVLIVAILAIALNLLSGDKKEEALVDLNNLGTTSSVPSSNDQFTSVPVNDESVQFEQIVKEIRQRQQNAPEQSNTPMPSRPITNAANNVEKIQMPDRIPQAPSAQVTSQPRATTPSRGSSMTRINNGNIAENGIYLQVGAFSKTPNKQFLDSVGKYSYRVQEIMINSKVITRYLIGPYASRNAAQRDVDVISRDITTPVILEVR